MGRKYDPGPGKHRGSHVDYVVEGVLPEGSTVPMVREEGKAGRELHAERENHG